MNDSENILLTELCGLEHASSSNDSDNILEILRDLQSALGNEDAALPALEIEGEENLVAEAPDFTLELPEAVLAFEFNHSAPQPPEPTFIFEENIEEQESLKFYDQTFGVKIPSEAPAKFEFPEENPAFEKLEPSNNFLIETQIVNLDANENYASENSNESAASIAEVELNVQPNAALSTMPDVERGFSNPLDSAEIEAEFKAPEIQSPIFKFSENEALAEPTTSETAEADAAFATEEVELPVLPEDLPAFDSFAEASLPEPIFNFEDSPPESVYQEPRAVSFEQSNGFHAEDAAATASEAIIEEKPEPDFEEPGEISFLEASAEKLETQFFEAPAELTETTLTEARERTHFAHPDFFAPKDDIFAQVTEVPHGEMSVPETLVQDDELPLPKMFEFLNAAPEDEFPAVLNADLPDFEPADVLLPSIEDAAEESVGIENKYIVFRLNDENFAFPAANIAEIVHPMDVTPLPFVPSWLLGVANLRGDVFAVIDLRRLWEKPAATGEQRSKMLIVKSERENVRVAVKVDAVQEIYHLVENRISHREMPEAPFSAYLQGVSSYEGGALKVLSAEQFLSAPKLRQI